MSSWYRKCPGYIAGLVMLAAGGSAEAAQYYFQPRGEVGTEVDSNRNLVINGNKTTSEGYNADVSGILGISTPRSDSTIRPEIGYSNFPKARTNDLRTILDLYSQFLSLRSRASLEGRFERRATYSSELASAQFNPVNPNLPTTPETGRISNNAVRTLFTAVPRYTYSLTPRLDWGVTGTFQSVAYSGTDARRYVSYDYYLGGTSFTWAVNPRVATTFGVFASRESAKDGSNSVKAGGATLAFDFKWSKQLTGRLELTGERDQSETVRPLASKNTATGIGATFITTWKGEISKLQLSTGRTFTPSGSGGTFRADQFQIEYRRDLTERLAFTTAGRAIRYVSIAGGNAGSDYDYVNAMAGLKWKITPTWYLGGGAGFLREKIAVPVGTASNGMLYVSLGYEGLGRPR